MRDLWVLPFADTRLGPLAREGFRVLFSLLLVVALMLAYLGPLGVDRDGVFAGCYF